MYGVGAAHAPRGARLDRQTDNNFYGPEKPVDWGIPSRHRFQYDLDDQGVAPF